MREGVGSWVGRWVLLGPNTSQEVEGERGEEDAHSTARAQTIDDSHRRCSNRQRSSTDGGNDSSEAQHGFSYGLQGINVQLVTVTPIRWQSVIKLLPENT